MHPKIAQRRGVVGLASDALSGVARLVETELTLARAEFNEKLQGLRSVLVLAIAGAVLLVGAVFLLLQAAVVALVEAGVQPHWATLLVAGACAAIGGGLVYGAKERLDVTPTRTLDELSRDAAVAKEHLS
jgi:hypothetical protein